MLRRIIRILMIVGLVAIVSGLVAGQYRNIAVQGGHHSLAIYQTGIYFLRNMVQNPSPPEIVNFHSDRPWHYVRLLNPPVIQLSARLTRIILPWWLLLVVWATLTVLAWRVTRSKVGAAFPVDLSSNSK